VNLCRIPYHCDGVPLTGLLADGSRGASAPGILLAHESLGVTEHVKQCAERLAGLGYVALVLDLFGVANLDMADARRYSAEVMTTPNLMYKRTTAALELLAAQSNVDSNRLAAVGFCLGGVAALELARHGAPVLCAIGFHPGLRRVAGSRGDLGEGLNDDW
jgi:dienelactone hydrolase